MKKNKKSLKGQMNKDIKLMKTLKFSKFFASLALPTLQGRVVACK